MGQILILKLGALGDMILATSLIRQIADHHRGERVHLLTAEAYGELFNRWPGLEVITFPRHGLLASLGMLRWIRRGGFSRIYDLQSNDRTAVLCALSGIRERVGNHPRFPYTFHPASPWRGESHIYDRMLEVLRAAGVDAVAEPPVLPVTAEDIAQVSGWLGERGLAGKPWILVHAGGSSKHPEKRWPGFPDLVRRLGKESVPVIAIGDSADATVNRDLAEVGAQDATSAFTLSGIVELGRHALAAVTNDSAPMHALAASGIPVYGLFGPTDWRRHHAVGQEAHVISAGHPGRLISEIHVETVLASLRTDGILPPAIRVAG